MADRMMKLGRATMQPYGWVSERALYVIDVSLAPLASGEPVPVEYHDVLTSEEITGIENGTHIYHDIRRDFEKDSDRGAVDASLKVVFNQLRSLRIDIKRYEARLRIGLSVTPSGRVPDRFPKDRGVEVPLGGDN